MKDFINEYLNTYIKENDLTLSETQYRDAYKGVEYWLQTTIQSAVSDVATSVM